MQSRKILEQGDFLYQEGDAPENAYIVISGSLEISAKKDGNKIVIGRILPGELVGEMSVINDSKRSATVVALEPCVVVEIDKKHILERIEKSDPIIRSLLTGYARRFLGGLDIFVGTKNIAKSQSVNVIDDSTVQKIKLEHQLKQAIKNKQLGVLLQPILEVATDEIVGYEALIRWNHPEHGPIPPLELIALAEETSLIDDISDYVIDYACHAIRQILQLNGEAHRFISINVSPNQLLRDDFVNNIINKVDTAKLPKGSLHLEITESSTLLTEKIEHVIDLCHEHGIKVALDNFGTGSSNLALVQKLKFDTLIIDRSFTIDVQHNHRSMALIDMIVNLGYRINAEVLVAGIESEEMLDYVRELNCRYAQGYHIGKPQELAVILSNNTADKFLSAKSQIEILTPLVEKNITSDMDI